MNMKLKSFIEVSEEDLKELIEVLFDNTMSKVISKTKDRIECEVTWEWAVRGQVVTVTDSVVFTKDGLDTSFGEAIKTGTEELYEKFLVARGLSKYQEDNPFMED